MTPTLESKINITDPCPFQDGVCETAAMTIDTGYVDSNDHLGINSPRQNRIQFRKLLSCAVIPADRNYSTPWTTNSTPPLFPWDPNDGGSNVKWKYYNLGRASVLGIERPATFAIINSTASYDKIYTALYVQRILLEARDYTHTLQRYRLLHQRPIRERFYSSPRTE